MPDEEFFEEQAEQSLIKSTIVAKYFDAWARVMIGAQKKNPQYPQKIAYIDLFAGPGRYRDGTKSTPLEILQKAIEQPELRERLVAVFNDKKEEYTADLRQAVTDIPGIDTLRFPPKVHTYEVGDEIAVMLERIELIPSLFFIDPWGYKGLSLQLISSALRGWGCEAIIFFNYNRINMGINNPAVQKHIEALFGPERVSSLRERIDQVSTREREALIIEELCQALKGYGAEFVLPFRFKHSGGKRISHHLIFTSKDFRGYEIMKDIMARESSTVDQGVPSFEYFPAAFLPRQALLFQLDRPLDDLREVLLQKFSGITLSMREIYRGHSVDTPYIAKNYKDVLRSLFDDGIIEARSPKGQPPRKGTFSDQIIVTFPARVR